MSHWFHSRIASRCTAATAVLLVLAGLLVQGGDAWGDMVLGEDRAAGLALIAVAIGLGVAAIALALRGHGPVQPRPGRPNRLWPVLAALMLFHTAMAVHLMRSHDRDGLPDGVYSASDPRHIDCYTFQLDAARKLMHGINPYGTTQANIYNQNQTGLFYGPGMVIDGRVQVGLQYPPVTFLSVLPGYLLGDVRYGYLGAVLLAAVFAFATAPGVPGICMSAFLLLGPITFIVEDRCWTEPLVLMLLCATGWAAVRRPRWLPLAFGLFLASKQYNLLALPIAAVLLRPFAWKAYWRFLVASVAIAAATFLPFALLNSRALWHDLVLFHLAQPLRHDALSFGVAFPPCMKIGPVLLLAFLVWIAWRGLNRTALFPAAYGMAMLLFVSSSKQAFMNYYFLITGSLLFAAAMFWSEHRSSAQARDVGPLEERSPAAAHAWQTVKGMGHVER